MSDELPPIWALDKAAKAAGSLYFDDWATAQAKGLSDGRHSIIAHARTIAQYEQPPVDEDEEALIRLIRAWDPHWGPDYDFRKAPDWPAALAQFKRELEGWK
jgi:hypothetical protein